MQKEIPHISGLETLCELTQSCRNILSLQNIIFLPEQRKRPHTD